MAAREPLEHTSTVRGHCNSGCPAFFIDNAAGEERRAALFAAEVS
jgi:hypothetical protein